MRQLFTIIILLFVLETTVSAQKDFYPGYVVTNSGDTISGILKDRKSTSTSLKIYKKVHFRNERGRKKKYGPNEILAYKRGNDQFHSVWYDDLQFLRVMESGRVTYYIDESVDADNNNLFETKILKRDNENRFTTFIGISFRKKTMKYFADCPELVGRLEVREFRYKSLGEAVRFYNTKCH